MEKHQKHFVNEEYDFIQEGENLHEAAQSFGNLFADYFRSSGQENSQEPQKNMVLRIFKRTNTELEEYRKKLIISNILL